METTGILVTVGEIKRYMFGGNSRFTLVSRKTGKRFTFRIRRPAEDRPWFVSLLSGPDNMSDYTFMGTIFQKQTWKHSPKSSISPDACSASAFNWFFKKINELPDDASFNQIDVYHEGRCGRCGRDLTVPESISTGFGPECADRV